MARLSLFLAGVLFAFGLALGGMTDANKVIGFLDPTGGWDPSLALVMAGAIAVHAPAYRLILVRPKPLFEPRFSIPTRRDVTPRLVLGAALFGAGWALGGYCPGPGLVSAVSGSAAALVFVLALSVGWTAAAVAEERLERRPQPTPPAEPGAAR